MTEKRGPRTLAEQIAEIHERLGLPVISLPLPREDAQTPPRHPADVDDERSGEEER